jgi:hypothetical protein
MDWKPKDWIEHATFGLGWVSEDRGDRLDIQFIDSGAKTILKTANLKPGQSPPNFKFSTHKSKSGPPKFKTEHPPSPPPLDFGHLVSCFVGRFPQGFEGQDFHVAEREYKEEAAGTLKEKLSKEAFESLLRGDRYAEVADIAKHVLRSTNLVHYIEKTKFVDAVENMANHEQFANALYNLLHGSEEMEGRFLTFCDLLDKLAVGKWTVATYFQFLASDGRWMFMKPEVTKTMARSVNISLNYKPEPNWLTYSKLQELADRVELELKNRKLIPHSRIDVQGFIWASIQIEEGKY